jgi:DNA repair ATPase RecN
MTPSQSKIEANRIDAQSSTGSTSAGGKAISSKNAIRSGITARTTEAIESLGETQAEIDDLRASYEDKYASVLHDPDAMMLVETKLDTHIRIRRPHRFETKLCKETESAPALVNTLEKLSRQQARLRKAWDKATAGLRLMMQCGYVSLAQNEPKTTNEINKPAMPQVAAINFTPLK